MQCGMPNSAKLPFATYWSLAARHIEPDLLAREGTTHAEGGTIQGTKVETHVEQGPNV